MVFNQISRTFVKQAFQRHMFSSRGIFGMQRKVLDHLGMANPTHGKRGNLELNQAVHRKWGESGHKNI